VQLVANPQQEGVGGIPVSVVRLQRKTSANILATKDGIFYCLYKRGNVTLALVETLAGKWMDGVSSVAGLC
jgi:hypothetical protein